MSYNKMRIALALGSYAIIKNNRQRVWVKNWRRRELGAVGEDGILNELEKKDSKSFYNYLRMDKETFYNLLDLVKHKIKKESTHLRETITPAQRLATTLRFLAAGMYTLDNLNI